MRDGDFSMKHFHAFVFALLMFFQAVPARSEPIIFERKDPINPLLNMQDEKLENYAASFFNIVGAFVEHEEEFSGPSNFVMIERSGLVADGKLNVEKMYKFNIPREAVDKMARTDIWDGGCGTFDFVDSEKKVAMSISAIDASMPLEQKQLCVDMAVGIGLGLFLQSTFPKNRTSPAVLVYAAAAGSCKGKTDYKSCVTEEIGRMLADIAELTGATGTALGSEK